MKRFIVFVLSVVLAIGSCFNVYAATENEDERVKIHFDAGVANTSEATSVSISNAMNNGSTEALGQSENVTVGNIINILEPGNYEFSGTIEDAQISVNANEIDGEVNIILNNAHITCENAPAIFVYSKDIENDDCKVTIKTVAGTENSVTGGRIKASVMELENQDEILYSIEKNYDDDGTYYERYKYDGAISSDISINFDGEGTLNVVTNEKEGIESKMHITIDGGTLIINSVDDSINGAGDGKSLIAINDGTVIANLVSEAEEGDGIDSNGYIYINGGNVFVFSCPGTDSGLDSDMGTYINGGNVFSTSSMTENIKTENDTKYLQSMLTNVDAGSLITVANDEKNVIFAYEADRKIGSVTYSSNELKDEEYSIYVGGNVEGTKNDNGVYTNITSANLENAVKQETGAQMGAFSGGRPGFVPGENMMNIEKNTFNQTAFIVLIVIAIIMLIFLIILNVKDKETSMKMKFLNILLSLILGACAGCGTMMTIQRVNMLDPTNRIENFEQFGGMQAQRGQRGERTMPQGEPDKP